MKSSEKSDPDVVEIRAALPGLHSLSRKARLEAWARIQTALDRIDARFKAATSACRNSETT